MTLVSAIYNIFREPDFLCQQGWTGGREQLIVNIRQQLEQQTECSPSLAFLDTHVSCVGFYPSSRKASETRQVLESMTDENVRLGPLLAQEANNMRSFYHLICLWSSISRMKNSLQSSQSKINWSILLLPFYQLQLKRPRPSRVAISVGDSSFLMR